MRVVFVDNLLLEQKNGTYRFDLQPHLGLISLIAVTEAAGHQCVLYDPKLALARDELPLDKSLYLRMAKDILASAPDVVGLTTLGCNFICTVKVAFHLRRMAPEVPILLGGPHASILDREIVARWPQFDAVVRNESLPRPAYDRYPIDELDLPLLRVEAGRGCPFNCTFCSTASFFGRRYRLKSAERLCTELDYLHERYGIARFALTHDLFTVSKAKVREFCDAVGDRGYTWTCSARMDCVDPELLERMSEAGCTSIYYGVETGSPRMQKIVEKRLDLALFFPTLEVTHRVGMSATASFITGYPEEEQADQDQTLDLIGSCFYECSESLTIQLHLLTPEPGTKLIHEFGDVLEYDGHVSDFNFPTLEPDDGSIMESNPDVFMNHHYYRARLPRRQHVLVTSVYHVLYRLGFPVLRHLLNHYDRSLSRLAREMVEWAERRGDDGPYDASFLCRFMNGTWGPGHYLTSLVRYMLAASDLRADEDGGSAEGSPERRLRPSYVLSSSAALLRGVHDSPAILSTIVASGPPFTVEIPAAVGSRRRDYLLVLDRHERKAVRNFELDRSTADFLERFRRSSALGIEDDEAARTFVAELVRLGALRELAGSEAVARPVAAAVADGE